MKNYLDQIVLTEDGSPSMAWDFDGGRRETMHAKEGAVSETNYIYGEALRILQQNNWPPRVLSMGLGLGYNEFLAAAYFIDPALTDTRILSFEKDPGLREQFAAWVKNEACDLGSVYEKILTLTAALTGCTPLELKLTLARLLAKNQLQLHGELTLDLKLESGFSAILYDAFSGYSQPELWQQNHIAEFLKKYAAPNCVFTTYACTGQLKRALTAENFKLLPRKGFSFKREATLAIRGL